MEQENQKKIWGWTLSLNLVIIAILWLTSSTVFFVLENKFGITINSKEKINEMLGIITLLGVPLTIVGLVMLLRNRIKD